jgi:hypothetical protein
MPTLLRSVLVIALLALAVLRILKIEVMFLGIQTALDMLYVEGTGISKYFLAGAPIGLYFLAGINLNWLNKLMSESSKYYLTGSKYLPSK